jgi:spore germination protein KB
LDAKRKISIKQLSALTFVSLLSPAIRILPSLSVKLAGKSAWISALAAVIPAMLYLWMMLSLMKNRQEDEGLTELMMRSVGKWPGKILALLIGIWLVLYAGFILRTAAERLLSTVYRGGGIAVFLISTIVLVAYAAAGNIRSVARAAQVFAAILLLALFFILLFAAPSIEVGHLLPVSYYDAGGIVRGMIPVCNILSGITYFGFLAGYTTKTKGNTKTVTRWFGLLIASLFLIMLITIGCLSAELIGKLQSPFFNVIREIEILGVVERIEAVVVLLWIVTDLAFLSGLLGISSEIFKITTGSKSRRKFVWFAAALALAVSFLISGNAFDLRPLSEVVVPAISMFLTIILVPLILIIGRLRKKI